LKDLWIKTIKKYLFKKYDKQKNCKKNNWWDYFEFKEPKATIKTKIENFFNLNEFIEKYIFYTLFIFLLMLVFILFF
tara:strand:+ start:336 stop:566 length:231 start_codon:yes stop_codon:yes gene_type:complete